MTDFLIDRDEQVYIVYLGDLPELEEAEGFAAVEFAHHDLLNQVLDDDGRFKSSTISISSWNFRTDHASHTRFCRTACCVAPFFKKNYHGVHCYIVEQYSCSRMKMKKIMMLAKILQRPTPWF